MIGPQGITVLASGDIVFVAQGSAGTVSGEVLLLSPAGEVKTLLGELVGVHGTAYDSDRHLLYVVKFDIPTSPPPLQAAFGRFVTPANAALGAAVLRLDLTSHEVSPLFSSTRGHPVKAPASIVVDQWGDLWFTDGFHADGSVFWGSHDGSSLRQVVPSLPDANGIALSPDRQTLYLASQGRLVAFDIVGRGQLAGENGKPAVRTIAVLDPALRPDGIKTDPSGKIVLACREAGLAVFSPQGDLLSHKLIANHLVSNLAFDQNATRAFLTMSPIPFQPDKMRGQIGAIAWPIY